MAKRKSLNKRLSRYSKHSIGSAILDPDTETLGDEYPYWWKNVENNTIMRPSIDSNVLNQTSRHLDSDSQMETSEDEDEWWKVLEDSNTSKTLKMKMNIAKNAEKDASNNNTSTSESLGEVKIARKKFRMRSEPKRSRDNAFLNALDASTATSTVEFGQVDGRKSSTGNSATVGATVTNLKNINETEENSFNQSQKSTAVLKLKPKIFNKNYKNNDKNLFYDVLKESKLQISSGEGSKDKLQTATNSPVANSARSDNSALSLEDTNDIPHVFVPEAQSTILGGSSMHDSNSDIIRRVFEKKSKLLTRYKVNIKRDLFEDTLKGRESTDEVRKSDLIRRNDATGGEALEQSARSSRISEASEKDVRKKGEHASLPMKNTNEFPESNVVANTSVTSSDTLVLSQDFRRSPKTRIKVITRLGKHSGQVQLKNVLEESDSIDKDVTARSKDLLHLFREENLAFDNVESVRSKNNEVGENDSKNSAESKNLYLNLSYTSSDSNLSSLQKQVFQRDTNKIFQANDLEISRKRKSGNRKRSELVSPVAEKDKSAETPDVSPTRITESVSEEAKSGPRRNSEKKSTAQEKLVSPVEKEKDILVESENIAKRQSDRVSQSYRLNAAVFEGKESEGESPKQSNRRQSSTRELVSPVGVEDDLEEREEDISKEQTDRSSKSIKQYSLRLVSSDSEADENKVDSPRLNSRKQRKTREELVAPVGTGDDLEKSGEDISKRQTDRLTKSKIYSLRNSSRLSEVEDVENISQRSTRNRSKVSVGSVSSVTEQNETTEARDISTRQSDRSSKPIKHSFEFTSSDSEADENKAGSIKQSSTRELVASVEVEDELDEREEDISKQQSDRSSKSKIYSLRNSSRVSEVEDVENISQRSTRNRSKVSVGSVSSVTEQNRTTEAQDISTRQSDRSSKPMKHSFELTSSDSEADENKAGSIKESSTRELVASVGVEDKLDEREEDISKRQIDRLSKSKKHSFGFTSSDSEADGNKAGSPKRSSRKQSSTRELVSPVGVEDDLEERKEDISKKQTDRSSKSIKQYSLRLVSSDSEADENKVDSPRLNSRKQRRRTRKELVAPDGAGDDLEKSGEDISKRQTDRTSKSKIDSLRNSTRVSEVEDVESSPQRSTRSWSKVSLGSVPSVKKLNRTMEAADISTRQSDRSSKPMKHSFELTSSDSEADENKAGSIKQSSTRELVASVEVEDELDEREEDISKQQSDRSSKSKIYSLRNSTRVSEVEDAENSPQRSTRSRSKVSLGSVSSVTEQNRTTEARDIFKRRSDLTIQSGLFESDESREENEDDEVNGTQRHSILSGVEDLEEATSSKARKRLTLSSRDEMEPEEAENTAKRQKRNSNRIQARQSFSNVVSKIDQGDATRKSNSANISEKRVVLSGGEKAAVESQDENSTVQQKVSKSMVSVLKDSSVKKVREGVDRKSQSLSGSIKEIGKTEMSKTRFTNLHDRRDANPSKFDDGNSVNEREENARNVSRDKGVESKLQRDTNEGTNKLTRSVADKEQHFRESGGKVSDSKATNFTPSTRMRKLLSSNVSKGQQNIERFFGSVRRLPESVEIGKKVSLEEVNKKLEKVKEWAMSRVNIRRNNEGQARAVSKQKRVKESGGGKKANPIAQRRPVAKEIHKAFLVNGKVYKVPRLPRPKTWITDRLYNYLWKRLEPKYKLQTRVVSEKFIIQLSNIATLILKRKLYDNYKAELHALMKEMARLGLVSTRKDFYDFCHEFFPYELRVKIVPMLLPGNKRNIPYNANNLHTPLLADK